MPKDRLEIFVEQVNIMRACQNEFFKSRSQRALIAAKGLEKDVDHQLAEFLGFDTVQRARELAATTYGHQT
jgi:hypothetical protein